VTFRPKWSKLSDGTPAWQSCAPLFFAAALIDSCSALDPNVGPRRLEQAVVDGGLSDTGEPPICSDVHPGEVCFALDIRPLMNRASRGDPTGKGCKSCHYSTEAQHIGLHLGGLDLATLGALRRGGGSSGQRIVVPGKPQESVLVQVLRGQYPYANRMPKNGPFWDQDREIPVEIPLVERWIAEGAKGADGE
jgi:hypothetical protein